VEANASWKKLAGSKKIEKLMEIFLVANCLKCMAQNATILSTRASIFIYSPRLLITYISPNFKSVVPRRPCLPLLFKLHYFWSVDSLENN